MDTLLRAYRKASNNCVCKGILIFLPPLLFSEDTNHVDRKQ